MLTEETFLGLGHLGQSWESIGLAVPGANSLHHCSNNDTYPDPWCWWVQDPGSRCIHRSQHCGHYRHPGLQHCTLGHLSPWIQVIHLLWWLRGGVLLCCGAVVSPASISCCRWLYPDTATTQSNTLQLQLPVTVRYLLSSSPKLMEILRLDMWYYWYVSIWWEFMEIWNLGWI